MNVCYWCGKEVLVNEGGKEHIVPKTLFKDINTDLSGFIIPKENAHKACNNSLGNNYEHDFCQILFNYTIEDPAAKKHVESKIKNLKSKTEYAANQFKKMKLVGNVTQVFMTEDEKNNFSKILIKIMKGLFFKQKSKFLDLEKEYSLQYDWSTFNLENDETAKSRTAEYLKLINNKQFIGNNVFKYRFSEVSDGNSSFWEFVFYGRLPAYIFLIHFGDKEGFSNI